MLLFTVLTVLTQTDELPEIDYQKLERSYWIHASLAIAPVRGYWDAEAEYAAPPTENEVREAARLLVGEYAANRLYLLYHRELSLVDAERIFQHWRRHTPPGIELVPTLLLRMYDDTNTEVFTREELRRLTGFFKGTFNAPRLAVYDVHPDRGFGEHLDYIAQQYRPGLVRVGVQPEEPVLPPFKYAVQDTWSGFCLGKTTADWLEEGFGMDLIREWVALRNEGDSPIAWNLVSVGWDYSATEKGENPGYDDAEKNMPLPEGRNILGADIIMREALPAALAGFSSDLFILHVNSKAESHDKSADSFYATLRRGQSYEGYYKAPFQEIVSVYNSLRAGTWDVQLTFPQEELTESSPEDAVPTVPALR